MKTDVKSACFKKLKALPFMTPQALSELLSKFETLSETEFETLHGFLEELEKKPTADLNTLHKFFYSPHTSDNLDEIITNHIRSYGLLPHLDGYHYTRTAIKLMLKEKNNFTTKITALYAKVAKHHEPDGNIEWGNVERAIRHSLESAYAKHPHLFDVFMKDKAPTTSEFLYLVVDDLKLLAEKK